MMGNILIDDVYVVVILKQIGLFRYVAQCVKSRLYKKILLQVQADYFSSEFSRRQNKQALKRRMEISLKDGCRVPSRTSPSGG